MRHNTKHVLTVALDRVECWNTIDGSTATIAAGETITVCRGDDDCNTTILSNRSGGMPLVHKDGTPSRRTGYRFIVRNEVLAAAIRPA